jgi:hypothetical protein
LKPEEIARIKERNRKTIETPDGSFIIRKLNLATLIDVFGGLPAMTEKKKDDLAKLDTAQLLSAAGKSLPIIRALLEEGVVEPRISYEQDTDPNKMILNIHDISEETFNILIEGLSLFWEEGARPFRGESKKDVGGSGPAGKSIPDKAE